MSDRSKSNNVAVEPSQQNDSYERLRAWYLAHLRKSQLTSEIAGGMTPATLIRRDREALEFLIADQVSSSSSSTAAPFVERKLQKIKPATVIMIVNVVVGAWLIFEHSTDIEFSVRLAIALLLVLSSVLLNNLQQQLSHSKVTLIAVTEREKNIADYAYEAFWSVDEDFKFVACNQAFERLIGNPGYLLLGRSFL